MVYKHVEMDSNMAMQIYRYAHGSFNTKPHGDELLAIISKCKEAKTKDEMIDIANEFIYEFGETLFSSHLIDWDTNEEYREYALENMEPSFDYSNIDEDEEENFDDITIQDVIEMEREEKNNNHK